MVLGVVNIPEEEAKEIRKQSLLLSICFEKALKPAYGYYTVKPGAQTIYYFSIGQVKIDSKEGSMTITAPNQTVADDVYTKLKSCIKQKPPPASCPPPNPDAALTKEECKPFLTTYNIDSVKAFNAWAVANHPDKGGNTKIFQQVCNCVGKVFKGEQGGKRRKTRKGKKSRRMTRRRR